MCDEIVTNKCQEAKKKTFKNVATACAAAAVGAEKRKLQITKSVLCICPIVT